MKKQFIVLVSLFSLLAMPAVSLARPTFVPPGKLKVKIQGNATSTLHRSTTSTLPRPIQMAKPSRILDKVWTTSTPSHTTSTPPKTTSTPRVVKEDFNLTGEIVSVNASSSMLAIKIKTINHFSSRRDFRGKTVMIKVSANTSIKMSGRKNKNATLADLGPGQKVTIKGKVENEQFSASSIVAAGKPGKAKGILKFLNIFKK